MFYVHLKLWFYIFGCKVLHYVYYNKLVNWLTQIFIALLISCLVDQLLIVIFIIFNVCIDIYTYREVYKLHVHLKSGVLFAEMKQLYKQQTSSGGVLPAVWGSPQKRLCFHKCWGPSSGGSWWWQQGEGSGGQRTWAGGQSAGHD